MTIDEAIKVFEDLLEDGKCSETCELCNANELALEALRKVQNLNYLNTVLDAKIIEVK